jgi:hypothetical protein
VPSVAGISWTEESRGACFGDVWDADLWVGRVGEKASGEFATKSSCHAYSQCMHFPHNSKSAPALGFNVTKRHENVRTV